MKVKYANELIVSMGLIDTTKCVYQLVSIKLTVTTQILYNILLCFMIGHSVIIHHYQLL